VGVLVPRNALPVAFGFANKVAREEGDIGPDDGLDEIHNFISEEPLKQLGMLKVWDIHRLGADIGIELIQDSFKAIFKTKKFGRRKNGLPEDVVALAVVVSNVGGGDAVVR
jgi:hypothetical protein